jgi:anti-anti-sigma factor
MRLEDVPADARGLLQISPLSGRVGLRLDGELDLSTVGKLERALVELAATDGDVQLELAGLQFIDLSGATALANFAARLGRDRHLLLQDPSLMLRRMIRLLWAEQTVIRMSPP